MRSFALMLGLLAAGTAHAVDPAATTDTGAVAPPTAGPGPSIGGLPPVLADTAAAVRRAPLVERIAAISGSLLGLPYASDPMGEGFGRDPDPFARYDAFDCLTFVEEVAALALAGDPAHAAPIRHSMRYGGGPADYGTRHHFMELQWLPQAEINGWIRPTTADYGTPVHYEREVTPGLWAAWSRRGLFSLTDAELPVGRMALDFLPLPEALEVANEIRPGSIVMTVLQDRSWIPIWITHVGFVLGSEPESAPLRTLRHATYMSKSRRTRDNDLRWYLEQLQTYVNRPAVGIAIYELVEQGPRLDRLPTTDPGATPANRE